MAELILTEEEIAAASWADLDDAALGRVVKKYISEYEAALRRDLARRVASGETAIELTSLCLLAAVTLEAVGLAEIDLRVDRVDANDGSPKSSIELSARLVSDQAAA